jgi:N-acylneuraminate cytidylyltransferase
MNVAIIPARGGSTRIPGKNVRDFLGKPIIAWSIDTAKASGLFEHVIVSTDDAHVAEIATSFGAEVPFVRPAALASNEASTDDVFLHAILEAQHLYGPVEYACCIYATAPMLTTGDVDAGLRMLVTHHATSSFAVVRYDFPIEQAFVLDGLHLRARWPQAMDAQSQDLPEHYHDAATFYWADVEKFVRAPQLFGADAVVSIIPSHRCQDINTLDDWAVAEAKFRALAPPRG